MQCKQCYLFIIIRCVPVDQQNVPTLKVKKIVGGKRFKRVNGYNLFFSHYVRKNNEISPGVCVHPCVCARLLYACARDIMFNFFSTYEAPICHMIYTVTYIHFTMCYCCSRSEGEELCCGTEVVRVE